MDIDTSTQSREIDGLTVHVKQFAVLRASVVAGRLFKLLGPAFAELVGSFKTAAQDLGPTMHMLCASLEPEQLPGLIREILQGTTVDLGDGKKPMPLANEAAINMAFKSQTTMWKAVGFATEVNFRDFFDAARGWFGDRLAAMADSQSTSPQTSQPSQDEPSPSGETGG